MNSKRYPKQPASWQQATAGLKAAIAKGAHTESKDMAYWQDKVFVNMILYALPLSLVTSIPSIVIKYLHGFGYVPLIDIGAFIAIAIVVLNQQISLTFKKAFVAIALSILGVALIALLGDFGIGSIFLLAMGAYTALLFPHRVAYLTIAANIIIYAAFTLILYYKLFDLPLLARYDAGIWLAYSLNFLFLDIVLVVTIRYVLNGMESTLQEKTELLTQRAAELKEKEKSNRLLKESEGHYKSLFFLNPSPMWIFDADTYRILQVNESAVSKYGYTRNEFQRMSFKDLSVPEVIEEVTRDLQSTLNKEEVSRLITQHQRKNGEKVFVEVRHCYIPFEGRTCRLGIGRNITVQLEYIKAIEEQNSKLREISFVQSHIIRAPLARIMGLSDIIKESLSESIERELLNYLDVSVHELDEVIRNIVDNSNEISPMLPNESPFE